MRAARQQGKDAESRERPNKLKTKKESREEEDRLTSEEEKVKV